ncbi:helix-turn-helix domain-containing protein [Paenibacillus taichungensis]|uniref:AraC family transcriptional regulator n=1 Tax=Paenibacillus taichungensis TaxID=484184 RepID=UPI002DBEF595|nr:helix-turn-helix domain-containing protein [Paenibacillus taichungensis]MEC0107127.1 helix-turn-helix domain-containing protein [Paenibacillus taichungensis]MEC0194941.1 helix-turn-helix domain-containing protein [Paenibacillus taichungensis]
MRKRSEDSQKVFARILIGIIVSTVATLLVASTILYVNYNRIALRQVYRTDMNGLTQTSREVSKMTETAKSLSYQIYQDYTISALLLYSNPSIYEITSAMEQLDNYRMSLPFIESIYVYNSKNDEFFISSNEVRNGQQSISEIDDQGITSILDRFHDYKPFVPIPRTYQVGSTEETQVSSYTYLCYDTINDNATLNYAVVVNIKDDWLSPNMNSADQPGKTFIINEQGQLLSDFSNRALMKDLSNETFMQPILENKEQSAYFTAEVDGTKSLITYTAPDNLGWRYVRITPYDLITSDIRNMRTHTVLFCLGLLIAGVFLSYLVSRKLYHPIDKVLVRMRVMEAERRGSLHLLRQDFLRGALQGRETVTGAMLEDRMKFYGSSVDVHCLTRLVLLRIDHFTDFNDTYRDEVQLIKYAMMNICTETADLYYHTEAVDMGGDLITLIFNDKVQDEADYENNPIEDLLRMMQAAVMTHLRCSISFTIGPVEDSLENSIASYTRSAEASLHRLFMGPGCLIYTSDIMAYHAKEYAFPVGKERQLIDCLMTGKTGEAKQVYADIVSETATYPFTVFQLALSHLTMTLNHVRNTLKKNNQLTLESFSDRSMLPIHDAEDLSEVHAHFYRMFDELGSKVEEKRTLRHEELIRKINCIIERDYADTNLCLTSIADELAMSPIYVSRLYKQLTLKGLTDVINETRIAKAQFLLIETENSVADIAEQTGFTNSSYFYRMFKKFNGVTPNDYRRKELHSEL